MPKVCTKCGAENVDDAIFCTGCGAQMNENAEKAEGENEFVNTVPQENNAQSGNAPGNGGCRRKICCLCGAATGVISIILGIIAACLKTGVKEQAFSYGGDAYTGIQNAAAQTATNVHYLANIIRFGISSLLIIAGLALIFLFGAKLFKKCGEK